MNQNHLGNARARVNDLRDRLQDIAGLLQTVVTATGSSDAVSADGLTIAIRAILAVREDLESVCNEQLEGQ